MTTILRADTAADFLALVPSLAGYRARDSLVCVAFRGKRTSGVFRLDLPRRGDREHVDALVHTTISMMSRMRGADSLVSVIYTDERFARRRRVPRRRLGRLLTDRLRDAGFHVKDALCVAADGWASYLDFAPPALGHPLEQIETSPLGAQAAESLAGEVEPGEVSATAAPVQVARERRRAVRSKIDGIQYARGNEAIGEAERLVALDPVTATVDDLAHLVAMAQDAQCRDQLMLQFAFGPEVGRAVAADNERLAATESDDTVMLHEDSMKIVEIIRGVSTDRPNVDRVRAAIDLLKVAVEAAPKRLRPNLLCMLAWLTWSLGLGSAAAVFAERALAIEPGHVMTSLLLNVFGSGLVPEWAFHEPAMINHRPVVA